jgi:hypothetical protein
MQTKEKLIDNLIGNMRKVPIDAFKENKNNI